MKTKLKRIQAIAIALIIVVTELMIVAALRYSWYAIGIVFVMNLIIVVWILEKILSKE